MARYKGKLSVTVELIKVLLKLPEDVEITHVNFDEERNIVHLTLMSIGKEVENLTFLIPEGSAAFMKSSTWDISKED